jgi:hypothetical protein
VFFTLIICKLAVIYVENKYWGRALFALLFASLFKFDFGIHFYGLEYEDAYVFNFEARQFANDIFSHSFLTDGILVGSIENPLETGTYGGHFISYPVFLSHFYRLFGFEPHYICNINIFIEFLSIAVLSVFSHKSNANKLWFLLPVLYCIAPIMNVFANTGFSETFSSCICLSFVFLFTTYNNKKSWLNMAFCIFALFVSFLCKRENICLLILPFLYLSFVCLKEKTICKKDSIMLITSILVLIIYFVFIKDVFDIEKDEAVDIETSTFGIQHFIKLFPVFIQSLFSLKYFSISIFVFLISSVFVIKAKHYWSFSICILFGIYLLLYSAHYRGYFFVKYNEISVFETFRYLNNFFYLLPLTVIPLIYWIENIKNKRVIYSISVVLLSVSFVSTIFLRNYYSKIEREERFAVASEVHNYLRNIDNTVLITDNILLYQLLSDNQFTVCNIVSYNEDVKELLLLKNPYILSSESTKQYLKERFNQCLELDSANIVLKVKGMNLYKINKSALSIDNKTYDGKEVFDE